MILVQRQALLLYLVRECQYVINVEFLVQSVERNSALIDSYLNYDAIHPTNEEDSAESSCEEEISDAAESVSTERAEQLQGDNSEATVMESTAAHSPSPWSKRRLRKRKLN